MARTKESERLGREAREAEASPALDTAVVTPVQRMVDEGTALVPPAIRLLVPLTLFKSADEDEATLGSIVQGIHQSPSQRGGGHPAPLAMDPSGGSCRPDVHSEDGGEGAGAAEAGAGEAGGGGDEAVQTSDRTLPTGIRRGYLRVRAREEEGGKGAGDAGQGRGDKKRRVGFSEVVEEHLVPLEPRRNEDIALDVSQPRPVSRAL